MVVLEKDIREDDAEAFVDAIALLRGVLKVEKVIKESMAGIQERVIETRVRQKLIEQLVDVSWK